MLGCIRSCRAPPALCSSFSLSACRAHCDDDDDDDDGDGDDDGDDDCDAGDDHDEADHHRHHHHHHNHHAQSWRETIDVTTFVHRFEPRATAPNWADAICSWWRGPGTFERPPFLELFA